MVQEYIYELRQDEALDLLSLFYFEVWKLGALKKVSLRDAVQEAFEMDKFGLRYEGEMAAEWNVKVIPIYENEFRDLSHEAGIAECTEEGDALDLFRKMVFKKKKQKNMAMYAQKKLEIARLMKMTPNQAQGSDIRKEEKR